MPDISARAQERPAVFDGRQHESRVPVLIGLFMFVDGDLDVVFLAQLFHHIQRVGFGSAPRRESATFLANSNTFRLLRLVGRSETTPMFSKGQWMPRKSSSP